MRFRLIIPILMALLERVQSAASSSKFQIHIPKSLNKQDGYDHRDALFGIPPYGGSIQQQVYYADSTLCDSDLDPNKGYPQRPWQPPFILMIDRGDCTFVQKVRNAQRAGAAAVLIADNTCLCTFSQCVPDVANEPCEIQEPIMADDGSGSDITIPSFLLFKQDADPIKQALKQNTPVRAEMSFSMPSPNARVEYELWTTPVDTISRPVEQNFKEAAVALGAKATFTPHMYIYDGLRAGCDQNGTNECYTLCTNAGRYCAIDPDEDLSSGISGADVIKESLRRLCVWSAYGSDGLGKEYWNYVTEFMYRCGDSEKPELFIDEFCVEDAYQHAGVAKETIDKCMLDSGGLEGDVTNDLLDNELKAKDAAGIVLVPTLFVNQAPVRGQLSFATAFKAVCAGFTTGAEPTVCKECADCLDELACVQNAKCTAGFSTTGGVSFPIFAASLGAMVVVFCLFGIVLYKWQQRLMQEQVRGIVAQYMPLEENKISDTSLGIPDTDREFT